MTQLPASIAQWHRYLASSMDVKLAEREQQPVTIERRNRRAHVPGGNWPAVLKQDH